MILFLLVFNMRDAFSSSPGRLNLDYIIFVYRLNSQVPVYIVNGSLSACPPVILQEFSHAALAANSSPLGVIPDWPWCCNSGNYYYMKEK